MKTYLVISKSSSRTVHIEDSFYVNQLYPKMDSAGPQETLCGRTYWQRLKLIDLRRNNGRSLPDQEYWDAINPLFQLCKSCKRKV